MQMQSSDLRFIADVASPEPRRLYLAHTGIDRSSFGSLNWLGWELVARTLSATGDEQRLMDHWEESLLEILRYPDDYSDEPVDWRWENTGEPANLHELQPAADESRRFQSAIKTVLAPVGDKRLCFNLYDDGNYRFTLEALLRDGDLSAWVPREWSSEHQDLASAEEAARRKFDWLD